MFRPGLAVGLRVARSRGIQSLPKNDRTHMLASVSLAVSAAIGAGVLVALRSDHGSKSVKAQKVPEHLHSQFGIRSKEKPVRHFTTGLDVTQNVQVAAKTIGEPIAKDALISRFELNANQATESKELQVVGKGAFGRVVRGIDKFSGKEVAIKIVAEKAMSTEALLNEVEVLRRVRGHDSIIHLHQVLNCEKETYLVTEICEGGELLDRLITRGTYDEVGASLMMSKMASAIEHIHKCGYVHLDIKPENIVLAEKEGEFPHGHSADCRIVDFGMAQKISEVEGQLSLSRFDDLGKIGTMAYWSPELLEAYFANRQVTSDPRLCDVWSLGVVLYIMLLGCHPFDVRGEGDEMKIAKQVLRNSLRFDVYGGRVRMSKRAQDLVSRMLDPNPETRISMAEVLKHPWIASKLRKANSHLDRLPSSWVDDGLEETSEIDLHLETPDDRLEFFLTPKALDAYVRGLLIAAVTNGRKGDMLTANRLFWNGFKAILQDKNKTELGANDIDELLRTTGEVHVAHFIKAADEDKQSDEGEGLSFEEYKAILRKNGCVARSFKKGTPVFSEGAEPQGIYILTKGRARIEFTSEDEINTFAVIEPGCIIGETSIVLGFEKRRATVRCAGPCEVIFVPKDLFLRALAGSPALHTRIFQLAKRQQVERIHKLAQYLKPESMVPKHFSKGDTIYSQGDAADAVYFLKSGIVGANVMATTSFTDEPMFVRLAQKGPGDLFGLSALSKHNKRGSTIRCLTDVDVVALGQEDVNELTRENETMNFYFQTQAEWRKERLQERVADMERGVTEPQLLPLILEADEVSEQRESSEQEDSTSSYLMQQWRAIRNQKKPVANALEEYAKAVTRMRREYFKAGETIFEKGEQPQKFYIVDSGTVAVEYVSDTGEVMTLATFGPGDHFGEQSLLENRPVYVTTVRCVTSAEVLSMDRKMFQQVVGDGESAFARAVKNAMRQRQHRWVRNLLFLAKTEKIQRKKSASDEPVQVHRVTLKKGDVLFDQGDPADAVYFVHQGGLLLKTESNDLEDRNLGAGDTIGLESLRGFEQQFTATCTQDKTVLSKIPRSTLDVLIRDHEYVSKQLKRHAEKVAPLTELDRRSKSKKVHRKYSYSSVMKEASKD